LRFDLALFHAVNAWCGTAGLDAVALFADKIDILKGGIIMAAFWWFWFARPQTQRDDRQIIIATIIAVCLAILFSRVLASALPFRLRPLYTPGIDYHPPSLSMTMNQENWSSFPSDHAAMWFALAFGLWRLSRPAGIVAMVYASVWICLVRLYLGIHYPSDLVAGAIIGVSSTWWTLRSPFAMRLAGFALQFERRASPWFYAAAFLVCFEMAVMFDDVRRVLHGLRTVLASKMDHLMDLNVLLIALVAIGVLSICLFYLLLRLHRRTQPGTRSPNA
jgi:undecaprenyl-diphosphatase